MNGRRSRLQRKADRVGKTATERRFEEALGAAVRERDDAFRAANVEYEDGLRGLKDTRAKQRGDALARYQERRDVIVKKFAKQESAAA